MAETAPTPEAAGIIGRTPDLSKMTIAGLREATELEPYQDEAVREVLEDPDQGIISD